MTEHHHRRDRAGSVCLPALRQAPPFVAIHLIEFRRAVDFPVRSPVELRQQAGDDDPASVALIYAVEMGRGLRPISIAAMQS